jgi:hypothetical protein
MPKTRRPHKDRTLDASSASALRHLLAYVYDDEQSHCFSCAPDERANHIYMQAVRPLALASGFRSKAELSAEESQFGDESGERPEPDAPLRSFSVTFTLTSHYKRVFTAVSREAAIAAAEELFSDDGEVPFELDLSRDGRADYFEAQPIDEVEPMTTTARADRARQVLAHYVTVRGDTFEGSSTEIADLIADLLHLAARIDEGEQPITSTLARARRHYEAECAQDAS